MKIQEENFNYIYNKYANNLYNIAYGYTRNYDDAIDVVQNVYLKLLRCNKDFKTFDDCFYFLIRMTINESIELLRSNYKNKVVLDEELITKLPSQNINESIYDIEKAIEQLPVKYKTIVILYYYDLMPTKEIAKVLNLSDAAVRKRLERARLWMKEFIERN